MLGVDEPILTRILTGHSVVLNRKLKSNSLQTRCQGFRDLNEISNVVLNRVDL